MKAWVLRGLGDIHLEDVAVPELKDGEALVRVKRAGICSSDIQRIFGGGAYYYPLIPGHEFSGVVEDVRGGNGDFVGKHVGVFPLLPCFKCKPCAAGAYETCTGYGYIGSRRDGAFAEYVAVPVWNLVVLPDEISFEDAALLEPASVALHAVKRVDWSLLDNAAVVGDGTIGRFVEGWLRHYSAGDVRLFGRREAAPKDTLFDAAFEAVGSVDALRRCIQLTRPGGHIVLIGNPGPDFSLEQKTYWQVLRKQLVVHGSWNSSYPHEWRESIDALTSGELRAQSQISHRFGFDKLHDALDMLYLRKEKVLKIMIIVA